MKTKITAAVFQIVIGIAGHKDETGSYLITYDEHGELPVINGAEDISTFFIN